MDSTAATVDVTAYTDDAEATDTGAFQAAIDACADAGGGTVYVPAGEYETGTVHLRSDVTLHLAAGATVYAAPGQREYDDERVGPDGERAFLVASGVENVTLEGRGTFHGRGTEIMRMDTPIQGHSGESSSHPLVTSGAHDARQGEDYLDRDAGTDEWPVAKPDFRPGPMFLFEACENVLVRDLTLRDMPAWTVHLEGCVEADIRGVDVLCHRRIPNNDGIAITDSRNVHVSDCTVVTCDDSIVLNGTTEYDQPCENVTVSNCTLESSACAVKFGSQTAGPMREFTFENLVVRDSNRGLGIQHRDGGDLENVLFSNVLVETRLQDGPWWGNGEPVYVTSVPRTPDTDLGTVRNVRFHNVVASSENGALVYGSDDATLENVSLDDVRIELSVSEHVDSVGGNVDLQPTSAETPIVSHDISGVHCEGVSGLRLRDVALEWKGEFPRYYSHGLQCVASEDVEIDGFDGRQARLVDDEAGGRADGSGGIEDGAAAVAVRDVRTVTVRDCRARPGTAQFLAAQGVSDARRFAGNDLADADAVGDAEDAGFTTTSTLRPR